MATSIKRSLPLLRSLLLTSCHPASAPSSFVVATSFRDSSASLPFSTYIIRPFFVSINYKVPTGTDVRRPPFLLSRFFSKSTVNSDSKCKSSNAETSNASQDLRRTTFREFMSSVATAPVVPMVLGVAGAVPFLALTPPFPYFLPLPEALSANPVEAQSFYGAVILSFLGGPHWGLAMAGVHASPNHRIFNFASNSLRYVWGVVPSLLAWPVLLMPTIPKLQFLICSFGLALAVDIFFAGHGLAPPWYLPLRLLLSGIVILCLTTTLIEVLLIQKLESRKQTLREES